MSKWFNTSLIIWSLIFQLLALIWVTKTKSSMTNSPESSKWSFNYNAANTVTLLAENPNKLDNFTMSTNYSYQLHK